MLLGDPGELARIALSEGAEGLRTVRLEVGRPVHPMLAGTAPDLAAAFERTTPAAIEWKLDGARIQVHRSGDDVAVYTRSLDDVTGRVPEVVEAVRGAGGRPAGAGRRGDRAAPGWPAAAVPGDRLALRQPHARWRSCGGERR